VFCPHIPPINAHDGVIKVETTLGIEVPPHKTEPSIKYCTDNTRGIYQYVFLAGIKYTDDAEKNRRKLLPRSILNAFY
jgi:hypothetical protein